MKCYLGISNFLEEISSLPHSIVFLCSFALITEEGFLISPCYSLKLRSNGYFLLCFSLLFFSQLFVRTFAFLRFLFLGMVLITASYTVSRTSIHSSSGTLSIRSNPLNLFVTSTWFRSYLNSLVVFPSFFNLSLNLAIRSSWSDRVPEEL